ncbi:fungal-specific transcription factor domain-containing protein [Aspergillus karnatakaensis]|uniref:transcription factor domain-containing protein n=1 Tax=Aspergillus karnatakaensis TaxID=1810916 RepID=UPI003CCC9CCC
MPTPKTFSKRRHTTMACVSCRESKVKCDGAEPACSNCAHRNRECRYQAVDKRKLPLRVAIELLSNRVDQLCHFIRDHGLQPPPMSQERDVALGKVLEILGLAEINSSLTQQAPRESTRSIDEIKSTLPELADLGPRPTHGLQMPEVQRHPEHAPDAQQGNPDQALRTDDLPNTGHDRVPDMPAYNDLAGIQLNTGHGGWDRHLGTDNGLLPISPYVQNYLNSSSPGDPLCTATEGMPEHEFKIADDDQTLVDELSSPEDIEGLIDELSDRVGTLRVEPGGQTHFYGPTSTFNLADMLMAANSKTQHTAQSDALECLNRLGANKIVPPALEEHLVNLYFCWQDPSFHVVVRRTYEEARAKRYVGEDTSHYSESLRNAMCALGASFETRYHQSFVTFPKSLVEFFGDRAKALLEVELDNPCVATVQALIILSNLEVGSGREARGWLYSGMAIRLAFNLALHLDMSSYASKGLVTVTDANLRRTVFWAAFITDSQLGFHLGRPFRTHMDDVTVGKPNLNADQRDSNMWFPYVSPNFLQSECGVPDCMDAVCEEQVTLCEIMAPCGYFLYGTSNISKEVLQQLNEKVVAKLLNWKAKLPSTLQIHLGDQTTPYVPQVLLLHMQYYQNIIYAHRPWMSKSHLQPQPPQGPGHRHAREMCIQSAIAIAKILTMYETRYTLRRIHTKAVAVTSSAVLLLLFAAVTQYRSAEHDNIAGHLSTCFRALDEYAISWPSASRAKDLLLRLQRRWEIRTRANRRCLHTEDAVFSTTKLVSTPIDLHGSGSKEYGAPYQEHGQPQELNLDTDIDWMLLPDGQSPSENRAADLYSLLSSTATIHLERGSL